MTLKGRDDGKDDKMNYFKRVGAKHEFKYFNLCHNSLFNINCNFIANLDQWSTPMINPFEISL